MWIEQLVHFCLVLTGFTYLITQSVILRPLRLGVSKLGKPFEVLIYCPACTGFWVGLALGWSGLWPWSPKVVAAVAAAGLMALWSEYGPPNKWQLERGSDGRSPQNTETQENEH